MKLSTSLKSGTTLGIGIFSLSLASFCGPHSKPGDRRFADSDTVQFGDAEPDGRAFGYTFPNTVNVNGEMAAAKRISLPLLFSSQISVRRGNSGAA